jgi:acyl-CoA synthetase (AMP-forming)/AMP-acid ligase II
MYSRVLEELLLEHPDVEEVCVLVVEKKDNSHASHAFIRRVTASDASPEMLCAWCEGRLSRFEVPDAIHILDDFPKKASGAVSRRDLLALTASDEELCAQPRIA